MKEKKTISVGVRLNPSQEEILKSLIECGKATRVWYFHFRKVLTVLQDEVLMFKEEL